MHNIVVKERAVGFVDTGAVTMNGNFEKILQVWKFFNWILNCASASVLMEHLLSGNKVCVILNRQFWQAIYVHCNFHHLNLFQCFFYKRRTNQLMIQHQ